MTHPDSSPETPRSDIRTIGHEASSGGAKPSSDAKPSTQRTPGPQPTERETTRQGVPVWLFIVVLVLSAVAVGWQLRAAGQLEREIVGLEADLARTTALLGAHQTRLGEIRGGVHELVDQVEGLRALVDANPEVSRRRPAEGASSSSDGPKPEIPSRLPVATE